MIGLVFRLGGRVFKGLVIAWLLQACADVAVTPPADAIASAHLLATRAGFEILEQQGNAFDAAISLSAALAVVEPYSSGLGGGGFWLLYRASDGKETLIDGRERAPTAASRDMFLNAAGEFDPKRSMDGPLAAGIPGMPAALVHLAQHFGRLPLKTSLAPAIRYAREGFVVSEHYLRALVSRQEVIQRFQSSADLFLQNGALPEAGFRLIQKDLANTLERIVERGRAGFYQGAVAQALVDGNRQAGGRWTFRDLDEYPVIEREPLHFEYKGIRITSASPPSSGGVVLAQ
ncbi:MAG: gamma-glutamyltransferase, partial [Methylococcales bacterium]